MIAMHRKQLCKFSSLIPLSPSPSLAGDDGLIHIWDVAKGTLVSTTRGHAGFVRSMSAQTMGGVLHLLTCGQEGMINVWALTAAATPRVQLSVVAAFKGPSAFLTVRMAEDGAVYAGDMGGHASDEMYSGGALYILRVV